MSATLADNRTFGTYRESRGLKGGGSTEGFGTERDRGDRLGAAGRRRDGWSPFPETVSQRTRQRLGEPAGGRWTSACAASSARPGRTAGGGRWPRQNAGSRTAARWKQVFPRERPGWERMKKDRGIRARRGVAKKNRCSPVKMGALICVLFSKKPPTLRSICNRERHMYSGCRRGSKVMVAAAVQFSMRGSVSADGNLAGAEIPDVREGRFVTAPHAAVMFCFQRHAGVFDEHVHCISVPLPGVILTAAAPQPGGARIDIASRPCAFTVIKTTRLTPARRTVYGPNGSWAESSSAPARGFTAPSAFADT